MNLINIGKKKNPGSEFLFSSRFSQKDKRKKQHSSYISVNTLSLKFWSAVLYTLRIPSASKVSFEVAWGLMHTWFKEQDMIPWLRTPFFPHGKIIPYVPISLSFLQNTLIYCLRIAKKERKNCRLTLAMRITAKSRNFLRIILFCVGDPG